MQCGDNCWVGVFGFVLFFFNGFTRDLARSVAIFAARFHDSALKTSDETAVSYREGLNIVHRIG